MICRLQDPEIIERNPFQNCKLEPEKYARILTQIVSSYTNGCVLAINEEWESGKTTFVKMWRQHLNKENFKTQYFNMWEHDFVSNPLVGLVMLKKISCDSFCIGKLFHICLGMYPD